MLISHTGEKAAWDVRGRLKRNILKVMSVSRLKCRGRSHNADETATNRHRFGTGYKYLPLFMLTRCTFGKMS